ncbi:MAG: NAD(P)-dependent oxidoreductase [Bacteroidota bacterium]
MKSRQVLITAPAHPCLQEGFEKAGYEVTVQLAPDTEWLAANLYRFRGIVVASRPAIDRDLLDVAIELRWIARLGSGMEHIDVEYATSRGIRCISSPEGNSGAVAEHALGMLLNLMKQISVSAEEVKRGIWIRDMQRGELLTEKVVGIIGLGNTGLAFAHLLASFGVIVFAHDKYKNGFSTPYIREVTLAELQKYAQVISLHLPLTAETLHYADPAFFRALERKPYFINTGRGGLVDTNALIDALGQQQIAAAALDVLENEQPNTYSAAEKARMEKLFSDPRVLITPHIAGYSKESFKKMSEVILSKLKLGDPEPPESPDIDW